MDPYECQRQFQKYLARLNASSKATENALQFFLHHTDLAQELLACITTTMGKEKLNNRLNIAFFIKDMCTAVWTKLPLETWLHRDFLKIVDRAVPTRIGSIALANLEPMRRVVDMLSPYLTPELIADATALLDSKANDPPTGAGEVMSREDVLKRMEDDRERTKKIKESKWQVVDDSEFDTLWETLDGLTELDRTQMKIQNEIAVVSRIEV